MTNSLELTTGISMQKQLVAKALRFSLPWVIHVDKQFYIGSAVRIPRIYGVAWHVPEGEYIVSAIIPLNIVMAAGHWAYWWLRIGCAAWFLRHRAGNSEAEVNRIADWIMGLRKRVR